MPLSHRSIRPAARLPGGNLAWKSREGQGQTDGREGQGGGLYPVVIDSAFGSLEVEYRRDVAKWIRSLSPQIILLVSETQWRREVEEELQPFIGKE